MTENSPHRHENGPTSQHPQEWHGQKIITETDLHRAFPDDDAAARRLKFRRIRHGMVLIILVAAVVAAVFVAVGIFRGEIRIAALQPRATPPPSCPAGKFAYVPGKDVSINVYNGTQRPGLATSTAALLKHRAFRIGAVGNAPGGTPDTGGATALVVAGPEGFDEAFTVQQNIPGTSFSQDDRADASVSVILGPSYARLVDATTVQTDSGTLSCPNLVPPAVPSATP